MCRLSDTEIGDLIKIQRSSEIGIVIGKSSSKFYAVMLLDRTLELHQSTSIIMIKNSTDYDTAYNIIQLLHVLGSSPELTQIKDFDLFALGLKSAILSTSHNLRSTEDAKTIIEHNSWIKNKLIKLARRLSWSGEKTY